MFVRKFRFLSLVFSIIVLSASVTWALGFGLGETKEQLKLKYEIKVLDHGNDCVTVSLIITDEGRLNPLNSVDLVIPNKESKDGSGSPDLSLSLAIRKVDGKQVVRAHLKKELAERAEIQLRTSGLDGKQEPQTWYYHTIPIAEHIKNKQEKKK